MKTAINKKSIYVAYTGGTIGMQKNDRGYSPVSGFLTSFIKDLPEFYRAEMPNFTIQEYSPLLDSSDMTQDDWQRIADDIKTNYESYDGFVVLHGTDTMAFTASALSFMLQNLCKPVIITGSQIPLSEFRSDGHNNLLNSLYIAANYSIPEVCVFFNNKLYRGCRTTKVNTDAFDAFSSPNYPDLIETSVNIKVNSEVIKNESTKTLRVANISPQAIGIITLYPGISTSMIAHILNQPLKALILLTYGLGNAPQNSDFLECLSKANERGVILVNLTQCQKGKVNMGIYETSNTLSNVGVISGSDMTTEAAIAKLYYLLSTIYSTDQIRIEMQKNLAGELTE